MAARETVSLSFKADIGDLKREIGSIPGITKAEAAKMVRELEVGYNKAERAAKKAAQATGGAWKGAAAGTDAASVSARASAEALKGLGQSAGRTNEAMGAMGAALSNISPALGNAVSRFGQMANGLKGATAAAELSGVSMGAMAGALGVAGVAVGVAVVAYQGMIREIDQARAMTDLLREVSDSLEPSLRRVEAAELALAVATGAVTEAQAAQLTTQRAARDGVLDYAKAQRAQRQELADSIESANAWKQAINSATFGPTGMAVEWLADQVGGFSDEIEDAGGKLRVLDGALVKEAAAQKTVRDVTLATTEATATSTKAQTAHAAAVKTATTTRGQLIASVTAEADARSRLANLMGEIEASAGGTEKERAVNEQLAKRVALLDEVAAKVGYNAETEAAFMAAQMDAERQLTEIRLDSEAQVADARRSALEDQKRAADEQVALHQAQTTATLGATADLAAAAGDAIMTMATANGNVSKEGYRKAWAAQKALSMANVGLRAAEGIATAAALPPPADVIKAIAVGIAATTATAQIAASKPPSFNDTPGVVQMRGGGSANFAPGDMVVAGKDLGDMRRQLDRATGDRGAPVVQVVAVPSYEGRTYELARRDALRRPGADFRGASQSRPMGPGGW